MPSIALTSTPDRSARHVRPCIEAGLDPVLLPCISYAPAPSSYLETVRHEATTADWMLVTSPRAISALWPQGGMPDVRVAAVGPSTAAAVRTAGGTVELIGDAGAEGLLSLLSSRVRGATVLFPHAAGVGKSSAASLRESGAGVLARVVYEIDPIAPETEPVDAVAFGSPTSVRGWVLSRPLNDLVVGAIGSTTARALAEHSVEPDAIPPQPSFVDLIGSMADHLRDRTPT